MFNFINMQHLLKKWLGGVKQRPVEEKAPAPAAKPLELISIHIPKTAGTSFRNTLRGVYGPQHVVRLDIGLVRQEVRVEEELYGDPILPPYARVIHGHFSYPLLQKNFRVAEDIPVITWLRDPVERVISNYFYLAKRLAEELQEEKKGLNILKKMQRSLLEYANFEPSQNRMSKFLEGLELDDLFFVGIQEDYNNSLDRLAGLLGWQDYPVFHHNQTGSGYDGLVSLPEREQIRAWNSRDVALYEKALEGVAKGKWTP
ncbi:MAG: sulfotransferase family 2 domain-containing protein [Lewinellaceae bacterium]|nr:sulfotransferase family 2 domain-containing protein [Lewinellaceae bacterium]